jgi:hypothetical protein
MDGCWLHPRGYLMMAMDSNPTNDDTMTHQRQQQADEEKETLQLRKGFIREALRNGYDLVPMFHFGNTRMYRWVSG